MEKLVKKYFKKMHRNRKITNIVINCTCGLALHRYFPNGPVKLKELSDLRIKCLFCSTSYQFVEERGKNWQNILNKSAKVVDKLIFWIRRDASKLENRDIRGYFKN